MAKDRYNTLHVVIDQALAQKRRRRIPSAPTIRRVCAFAPTRWPLGVEHVATLNISGQLSNFDAARLTQIKVSAQVDSHARRTHLASGRARIKVHKEFARVASVPVAHPAFDQIRRRCFKVACACALSKRRRRSANRETFATHPSLTNRDCR